LVNAGCLNEQAFDIRYQEAMGLSPTQTGCVKPKLKMKNRNRARSNYDLYFKKKCRSCIWVFCTSPKRWRSHVAVGVACKRTLTAKSHKH
jgi:hypothetical protein